MTAGQPTTDRSSPLSTGCFATAVLLVGQAIAFGAPGFSRTALWLLAVAIAITALGLCSDKPSVPRALVRWLMVLAVAGGFAQLAINDAFVRDPHAQVLLFPFKMMAMIAGVLVAGIFVGTTRGFILACFLILLAVHLLMGLTASAARVPGIDVYLIQTLGADALRHGQNPFAITFPDLYGPRAGFYPPGVVVDGRVQCGYFYPPLSLLLDLPGYFAGDARFSHVAAMTLSGLLVGGMRPAAAGRVGRETFGPAAVLMFSPRIFYQLQIGWIEPYVVLMLCATVFCAARGWRSATAVMLGLFCVTKQYAVFAAPAALLLLPRPAKGREVARWVIIAAASGCAVTLPLVLWDPRAFYRSTTVLYGNIFRADSISFLPPMARAMNLRPSLAYAAAASVPAIALTLWLAPRNPRGFAASAALILLCVFSFSTQSFGNYYLVAVAGLCAALAVGADDRAAVSSGARDEGVS